MRMRRLRAVASGRVQGGVGYRASVHRGGISMIGGVAGYVKNLPNGTVEIIAEGTDDQLQAVIEVANAGSGWSDVSELEVSYSEITGNYSEFSIAY